ncbi:MAG: c-type cytochrome domain-containing protein [Fidelibacterota bacterium]
MKIYLKLELRFWAILLMFIFGCNDAGSIVDPTGESPVVISFVSDVQPIFDTYCYSCHGPDYYNANLLLDTYEHVVAGTSDNGPVIIPENSSESLLIQKIQGIAVIGESLMPSGGPPLSFENIQTIIQWIDEGAHNTP